MKKVVIIVLLGLLLSACTNRTGNINSQIEDILSDDSKSQARLNNYSDYINYYLPSDIIETEANRYTFNLSLNKSKAVMNVNISDTINYQYYRDDYLTDDGFIDDKYLTYSYDGSFFFKNNEVKRFFYRLYSVENQYLLHLQSPDINIYAFSNEEDIVLLTLKLMQILKSVDINKNKIIEDFSNKEIIDYQKNTVDLFGYIFPVSGRVDELMIDENTDTPAN